MSIRLTNEQSPQERRTLILSELKKEIENLKEIQNQEMEDNFGNQGILREDNENFREPLSIEKTEEFKILLSWGGGEDGFKLRFKDKELLNGVYYCADWGQYEEVDLNEDELNLIYEVYLFGSYPEE